MLTPERIKELRAKVGIPEQGLGATVSANDRIAKLRASSKAVVTPPKTDSIFMTDKTPAEQVGLDFQNVGRDLSGSFDTRRQSIEEANTAFKEGKQGLGETVATHIANIIGGATDIAGATVFRPVTAILSSVAGPITEKLGKWGAEETSKPLIAMHEISSELMTQATDYAIKANAETDPAKKAQLISTSKEITKAANEARTAATSYTEQLARGRRQAEIVRDIAPWLIGVTGAKSKPKVNESLNAIKGHFDEARDVLRTNITDPEAKIGFNKAGGETSLINQTKTNIVDGLKEKGLVQASDIVKSLEIPKGINLEGFSNLVNETIKSKLPTLAEGVTEGVVSAGEKVKGKIMSTAELAKERTMSGIEKVKETPSDLLQKGKGKFEEFAAKPTPKPVENVLQETPKRMFDQYAETARKAAENNKNATPLEIVGQRAGEALDTIQGKLDQYGKLKSSFASTFGDRPVGTIATKFAQGLENFKKAKTFVEGDTKLVDDLITKAKNLGNNPSALEVDQFIDYVQDKIYTSGRDLSVPVTDSTNASVRNILGQLNESLKNNLPEGYRKLNDKYSDLVDVRNELNVKLGKEGEKGGALMKRVFSPSDANTKKLFARVLEETGIDLVNEATLSKFLMEAVGDARQMSMLEQLQLPKLSGKGLLEFAWDKLTKSSNTPEKIIERARAMTK